VAISSDRANSTPEARGSITRQAGLTGGREKRFVRTVSGRVCDANVHPPGAFGQGCGLQFHNYKFAMSSALMPAVMPLEPSRHAGDALVSRQAALIALHPQRQAGLSRPSLASAPTLDQLLAPMQGQAITQRLCDLLADLPLFSVLSPAQRLSLALNGQLRRCARDDQIVRQDSHDSSLFVLVSGRAYAERVGDNGRDVLLQVLEPGARVGEMCLLDGRPHNATVRCVSPCEVLVLRGSDVLACITRDAAFCNAWTQALVKSLRRANRRIAQMSLLGVRDRVLLRLHEIAAPGPMGEPVVNAQAGRTELARMVGASREMVCRVLRGLEAEQAITVHEDRSITLHCAAPT